MSSFDIGLQSLDTGAMTCVDRQQKARFWIENASLEWDKEQAPFYTAGRLNLLPHLMLSPEEDAVTYFDVTEHAMPDSPGGQHQPYPLVRGAASRRAWCGSIGESQPIGSCQGVTMPGVIRLFFLAFSLLTVGLVGACAQTPTTPAAAAGDANPRVPGATGRDIVPGDKSTVSGDSRGTAEQKSGLTGGGR